MNEVLFDLQNPIFNIIYNHYKKEGKAIPVTGWEAHRVARRQGSHISLHNWLTDGSEVVSLTHRPPFTPRKIPGTHFS
jgi:hypothetical protein